MVPQAWGGLEDSRGGSEGLGDDRKRLGEGLRGSGRVGGARGGLEGVREDQRDSGWVGGFSGRVGGGSGRVRGPGRVGGAQGESEGLEEGRSRLWEGWRGLGTVGGAPGVSEVVCVVVLLLFVFPLPPPHNPFPPWGCILWPLWLSLPLAFARSVPPPLLFPLQPFAALAPCYALFTLTKYIYPTTSLLAVLVLFDGPCKMS